MRTLLFLLSLAVVWVSAGLAGAAPMHSDFATVRKEAATVVIGTPRFDPAAGWLLDVDTVIRGSAIKGTIPVKDSPDGHIAVTSERVVAFLTAKDELRWIGKKIAGPTIEAGVLQLQGFFDFNAHLVSPGVVTLAQLKALLAGTTSSQTFAVTLGFPDGKGGHKPSAKHFNVVYDPATRKGAAPGFSAACLDLNAVWGLDWGKLELAFTDTCPRKSGSRSLRVEGSPSGVDAAGNITVMLEPTDPVMTEPEYDAYIADGSVIDLVRVVRVTLADGSVWLWQIDKGLADPSGKLRQPGGMSSSYEQKGTVSLSTQSYSFGEATISLSSGSHQGGTNLALLSAIDAGAFGSCTFSRKGLANVACTVKQGAPLLVR